MSIKHFHEGELSLQSKTGMGAKIDKVSKVMMRNHLIDRHREFFEGLEYIFLGTVDGCGRPCATILKGRRNFVPQRINYSNR